MNKIIILFLFSLCDSKANPPHIIFILADDLGWNDVGFHGSNQIPTPNIDSLAYTGVILNNYYVTPLCTPSRSALMTGKYPIHTGLQHGVIHGSAPYGLNLTEKIIPQYLKKKGYLTKAVGKWHLGMQHEVIYGDQPWGLGKHEELLPQYLKRRGYKTRAVGKWHLGHYRAGYLPHKRGFDSHYGYWVGHQDYYDHNSQENRGYWGYDMRRGLNITWSDYGSYTTDLFTDEAVKIIKDHNSESPLFLYLAHLATHSANPYDPLQAPPERVEEFKYIEDKNRRLFAGMLSKLDDSVGAVVSALASRGMLNNSVIVFSTDNGGPAAGFNSNAASNWPLRGVKDTLWEGGVRGVGLIWSPLLQPRSGICDGLIHIADWLPTLLALSNSTGDVNNEIDGINQWPMLAEAKISPREEVLLNIDEQRKFAALKFNDWKLVKGNTYNGTWDGWYGPSGKDYSYNWTKLFACPAAKAINDISPFPGQDKIKHIRMKAAVTCQEENQDNTIKNTEKTSGVYLFNLRDDPCERINLVDTDTEILQMMENKLKKYYKTLVPPRNKPADPRSNPKYWGYAWVNWMDYL